MACGLNCLNCPCPQRVTEVEITGNRLVLVINETQNSYGNGDIIKIFFCQPIPISPDLLPVFLKIGNTRIEILNLAGNKLLSDQIRPRSIYCLRVGTNPDHLTVTGGTPLCHSNFIYEDLRISESADNYNGNNGNGGSSR